ncbi:MAG: winged helix-turn-helix transcriptional regulator [Myxococcota bacterium]
MRSYKQYCGVAKALDLVGQRWTLLIIRELLPGPRRFTDLLRPGLTPNVLSERLKHLKDSGLAIQIDLPPPASRKVWELTEQGRGLEPAVLALGAFGSAYMGSTDGHTLDVRWLMVSLQRRYRGGYTGIVEVCADDVPYTLHITPDSLIARDGRPADPTLSIVGPGAAVAQLLGRGVRSDAIIVQGTGLMELLPALGLPARP